MKAKTDKDGVTTFSDVEAEKNYRWRDDCRACKSKALETVVNLGVLQLPRFLPQGADELAPKAPLHLIQCADCGLLQLRHTTKSDLLFREYWYLSGVNRTMQVALHDLVESALEHSSGGTWLDIGANDGTLLGHVPNSFKKIAVEPARNIADLLEKHCDVMLNDYFSADALAEIGVEKADVITSAAMFYDVDEPGDFVRDIAGMLAPHGVWINQLNDAPTMIKQNAFDAICHEHLCYYDVPTLKRLYGSHGLEIVRVTHNDINGGSIRVVARRQGEGDPTDLTGLPGVSRFDALAFASRTERWRERMNDIMDVMATAGPVWGYGASTKGSVMLQYLGRPERIFAIADRNPGKYGLSMVGIPITDEATMRRANPKYLLVLPWAFRDEFVKREVALRTAGTTMVFPLPKIEFVL